MADIVFSSEDCEQIVSILNATEPSKVECVARGRVAVFEAADGREVLSLLLIGEGMVIIDTVWLLNQRMGTWTNVFHYLVDFCRRNQIGVILIPAVLTAEMMCWCEKNRLCYNGQKTDMCRQYKYIVQQREYLR